MKKLTTLITAAALFAFAGSAGAGLDILRPAETAHERDEAHRRQVFLHELVFTEPRNAQELLIMQATADRDDEPATDGQLLLQDFRNLGRTRGDDDGVERRLVRPACRAVVMAYDDVVVAQLFEGPRRTLGELTDPFDRVDLRGNLGQHGRRVAGTGPDFEDFLSALEAECLGHAGDDIGLRYGLPLADRQRRIVVGHGFLTGGHETFPRHLAHGVEDRT